MLSFRSSRLAAGAAAVLRPRLSRLATCGATAVILGQAARSLHAELQPTLPPPVPPPPATAETFSPEQWNAMISAALPAVVSIKVNRVRAFDTVQAGTVQATGFVVDKERGYIMTNRHVAGPGPIVAEAIFANNEEVPLSVAYYDPVHDFALFRFDPKAVQHMELVELPLSPDRAEVGADIVIIGNNAGEKSSIHRSTLARLDRNAPTYNRNGYNDMNTFYMHSASSTSGGSSGSPVLNGLGHAIALNAGGKVGTSAGFFLPLDRALRALRLLQASEPVTRGTLQAVYTHQPFDEARRLGLPSEEEAALRLCEPEGRGLLVFSEVVPHGPADGFLEPGDILLRVAGRKCLTFIDLEATLDAAVGDSVTLEVCRGGARLTRTLRVDDLHALTPSRYFEIGGGILNELSYQQARNHGVPPRGVYVAHPGYTLRQARLARGHVIASVGGVPTPDLDSFVRLMSEVKHGEQLSVKFYDLAHRGHVQLSSLTIDRKWFPLSDSRRSDPRLSGAVWDTQALPPTLIPSATSSAASSAASRTASAVVAAATSAVAAAAAETGATAAAAATASSAAQANPTTADDVWRTAIAAAADATCKSAAPPLSAAAASASAVAATAVAGKGSSSGGVGGGSGGSSEGGDKQVNVGEVLAPSLVTVDFTRPFAIDGETGMRYRGAGLVIDADAGIVAVDRNTVTSTLGDVVVTVSGKGAGAAAVPARVVYVHPIHNFALVQYDPKDLPPRALARSASLAPDAKYVATGASAWLVGLKSGLNEEFDASRRVDLVSRKTKVANNGWMKLPLPNPPRFQISNSDTIGLEVAPPVDGGVIANERGEVAALWTSCAYQKGQHISSIFRGLPVRLLQSAVSHLQSGEQPPKWRSLGAVLEPISMAAARKLGVADELLDAPRPEARAVVDSTPSAAEASRDGWSGDGGESVLCISHVMSSVREPPPAPASASSSSSSGPSAAAEVANALRGGDLLLSIDGVPIRSLHQAEEALQGKEEVDVQLVREGVASTQRCRTLAHDGLGTQRISRWPRTSSPLLTIVRPLSSVRPARVRPLWWNRRARMGGAPAAREPRRRAAAAHAAAAGRRLRVIPILRLALVALRPRAHVAHRRGRLADAHGPLHRPLHALCTARSAHAAPPTAPCHRLTCRLTCRLP